MRKKLIPDNIATLKHILDIQSQMDCDIPAGTYGGAHTDKGTEQRDYPRDECGDKIEAFLK